MKKLEEVTTPYNRVEVWQNNAGRIDFEVSGATHATWHPTRFLTGHAWDAITAGILSAPDPVTSILLLGLGGGTCLRQLRRFVPEARITAVEIDGEMITLARKYMELDDLNITVVEQDAFEFMSNRGPEVDIVIDDLYHARGEDVERPRAITPHYVEASRNHLHPKGSLVMNFVVGPGHDDIFQEACSTFRTCFGQTRRIIPPLSHNEVLVGTDHSQPLATPVHLMALAGRFDLETDREHWKELRTLKLR